jgi:hypothetical protein
VRSSSLSAAGTPRGVGPGEDQVDVEVLQHPGAPPVIARHEERLECGRSAGSGLGWHGEEHPACGQVTERGPHAWSAVDDEARPGPAGCVGLRQPGCGFPVLSSPGQTTNVEQPIRWPVRVSTLGPAASTVTTWSLIHVHPLGTTFAASLSSDDMVASPALDVVEEWPVAMDGLGLHHGHVLRAVAEQSGGQRDPGVAAPDDQQLVVLHAVLPDVAWLGPLTVAAPPVAGDIHVEVELPPAGRDTPWILRAMAACLPSDAESLRRHNGYYAGDFTRNRMCTASELSTLSKLRPPTFPIKPGSPD